jgi:hypothetical protein
MTKLSSQDVERLKSEGRFVHAGALAAALGLNLNYGCHYGMRSTRDGAMAAFRDGFLWASTDIRTAEIAATCMDTTPSSRYVASAYSYDRD